MKIVILYFGRPSDNLQMTSENIDVLGGNTSLEQLLNRLRNRGNRWAYELNESYVVCTINRKLAGASDTIKDGDEINIFSRKPWRDI